MKLQPKRAFGERGLRIQVSLEGREPFWCHCKLIRCVDFDLTICEGTYIVEGFASSAEALRRRLGQFVPYDQGPTLLSRSLFRWHRIRGALLPFLPGILRPQGRFSLQRDDTQSKAPVGGCAFRRG